MYIHTYVAETITSLVLVQMQFITLLSCNTERLFLQRTDEDKKLHHIVQLKLNIMKIHLTKKLQILHTHTRTQPSSTDQL